MPDAKIGSGGVCLTQAGKVQRLILANTFPIIPVKVEVTAYLFYLQTTGRTSQNMPQKPNLVITNTEMLTMDTALPDINAVAVARDRILAVGDATDIKGLAGPNTQLIDGQGLTLIPGLIDSHLHLLSLARTTQELECRPDKAPTVTSIAFRVFEWARIVPPGEWVRCFGYDDLALEEKRHPNRHDLDEISPRHPVRVDHRSGHAIVLNSLGLQMAGINAETPDPVDGVIERDANGEPTGVLFEMSSFLAGRVDFGRSPNKRQQGIAAANRLLLSYGITSLQESGPDNGPEKWQSLQDLVDDQTLQTRVTMMAGARRQAEFLAAGLSWGSGNHNLRLGHVKIMLTMTTGDLYPSLEELLRIATEAVQSGFPVAIHCIEQEAIAAATKVISELPQLPDGVPPHRIEHCSECPPDLVNTIQRSGALVVTQPGFIYWNGPSYRKNVSETIQPHLYPIGPLDAAGISVAFGSDAPVINPNPWPAIYSAVTRKDREGDHFPKTGGQVGIRPDRTLHMHTHSGAQSEGTQNDKGSITPGKLADLILVDANPLTIHAEDLKDIKVKMTIIGGKVVWESR